MRVKLSAAALLIILIGASLASVSGQVWLRLERDEISIVRGESGTVEVYVGEGIPGQYVSLMLADAPEWLEFSFLPEAGITPYTSTLRLTVPPDAPTGEYLLRVEAWSGELLVAVAFLKLRVLLGFQPPEMSFTEFTCPSSAIIGEKFVVNLTFIYSAPQETTGRLQLYVNGELETMIEFVFSGEGVAPLQARVTAPPEPGETVVEAVLQYFNPDEEAWKTADEEVCALVVEPIPTLLRVKVRGLPSNLTTLIQAIILGEGIYSRQEVRGEGETVFSLPLVEPAMILVIAQEEVMFSESTKYVVEDGTRQLFVQPGWALYLEFQYNPWHLLKREVEPSEDVLRVLESEEWFKEGATANITAPEVFQGRSKRYTLSRIEVDGDPYGEVMLAVDKPHIVRYIYTRYNKLNVTFIPLAEPQYVPEPPAPIWRTVGSFWIERGETASIPFQEIEAGGTRYIPVKVETELEHTVKEGEIKVTVETPGSIGLVYRLEAKLVIKLSYVGAPAHAQKVTEEWVPLGEEYAVDLDAVVSPTQVGERVEIVDITSTLPYRYGEEGKLLNVLVTRSGEVEIKLKRSFLVRNQGILGAPEAELECTCPPGVCEWVEEGGELRAWIPEGTPLTCFFPAELKLPDKVIRFKEGHVGKMKVDVSGPVSIYVHSPLKVYMKPRIVNLYRLTGETERGTFIGEGVYEEGMKVSWRVEPQEIPAEGVLGALGLRWRAVNPFGVEVMGEDKVVKVEWELTAASDGPLTIFLEGASIVALSVTAWEYHRRWKERMRREGWAWGEE